MALYRSGEGEQAIRGWCDERLTMWAVPHERTVLPTALGDPYMVTAGSGGPTVVLVPRHRPQRATSLDLLGALAEHRPSWRSTSPARPG